jgi:hypothetical protein
MYCFSKLYQPPMKNDCLQSIKMRGGEIDSWCLVFGRLGYYYLGLGLEFRVSTMRNEYHT